MLGLTLELSWLHKNKEQSNITMMRANERMFSIIFYDCMSFTIGFSMKTFFSWNEKTAVFLRTQRRETTYKIKNPD